MAYPAVADQFDAHGHNFEAWLTRAEAFMPTFEGLRGPPPAPRFEQDWFARLDAAMAYTMVRELRPRRIVEIGSGHSTRFMARAIADGGLACELVCIDPAPRAALAGLPLQHVPTLLQTAGSEPFQGLAEGDILFADSSHVAMPGTDVDLIFGHILPRLPAGVVVHLHDTFLPEPYPAAWDWRGYNEQLLTAAWLLSGGLEPLFASHFIVTHCAERLARSPLAELPLIAGAFETSLWAVKR